jgi:transposase
MMSKQIRQITLTKAERKKLRQLIRQTKDRKTSDRLRIILFKAEGFTHNEIANLLQVSVNMVTQCLQRYNAEGLEAVCRTNYQGKKDG